MRNRWLHVSGALMLLLVLMSCGKEQELLPEDMMQWEVRRVAVVLPPLGTYA